MRYLSHAASSRADAAQVHLHRNIYRLMLAFGQEPYMYSTYNVQGRCVVRRCYAVEQTRSVPLAMRSPSPSHPSIPPTSPRPGFPATTMALAAAARGARLHSSGPRMVGRRCIEYSMAPRPSMMRHIDCRRDHFSYYESMGFGWWP